MRDLKYCVRYKGKVYCWDDSTERVVEVVISDIDLAECPQQVMKLIMCQLKTGQEEIGG